MPKIERNTALDHLRRGWPVVHDGKLIPAPAAALGPAARRHDPLPAGGVGEYHAARHEDGSWTREGMEAVIRGGGSVLIDRVPVDRVEDLPPAEVLAGADLHKHEAVLESLDEQIAHLQAQRAQAMRMARRAADAAERKADAEERPRRPQPPDMMEGRDEERFSRQMEAQTGPPHDLPEGVPAHPGQPTLPVLPEQEQPAAEEGEVLPTSPPPPPKKRK